VIIDSNYSNEVLLGSTLCCTDVYWCVGAFAICCWLSYPVYFLLPSDTCCHGYYWFVVTLSQRAKTAWLSFVVYGSISQLSLYCSLWGENDICIVLLSVLRNKWYPCDDRLVKSPSLSYDNTTWQVYTNKYDLIMSCRSVVLGLFVPEISREAYNNHIEYHITHLMYCIASVNKVMIVIPANMACR